MASGWESEGMGFKPQHLQTTFDPWLPIATKNISSPQYAFND